MYLIVFAPKLAVSVGNKLINTAGIFSVVFSAHTLYYKIVIVPFCVTHDYISQNPSKPDIAQFVFHGLGLLCRGVVVTLKV